MFAERLDRDRTISCLRSLDGLVRTGGGWELVNWLCRV